MNDLERDFFDEYKDLDQLCKDILSSSQGVSEYIRQLENLSEFDKRKCPSCNADHRLLKHLRHIRNNIAHNNGYSGCTYEDLENVRIFRQKILNRQDTFSMLYQINRSIPEKPQMAREEVFYDYQAPKNYNPTNYNMYAIGIIAFIIMIAMGISMLL